MEKETEREFDVDIEKLVKFVDGNFKPFGRCELLMVTGWIWIIIAFLVLYGYAIILIPSTPLPEQVSLMLSFVVLTVAMASFMQTAKGTALKRLVDSRFKQLHPLLDDKRKHTEYFLRALLTMRIKNQKLELLPLYEIDKKLFDKRELLEKLYD